MGAASTSLEREAESIFSNLGYTVTAEQGTIRARRKWRVVEVTPMAEPEEPPTSGDLRCFVTWEERVPTLEQRLTGADLDYEWAIIGVSNGGDYVVSRSSTR
jgi:hypothetical protein